MIGLDAVERPSVASVATVRLLPLALLPWLACAVTEPPAAERLQVEYAGCAGARRGPVCVRTGGSTLTLWTADPVEELELARDGMALPTPPAAPVEGGFRLELELPSGSRELLARRPSDGASWRLSLEEKAVPEWRSRVSEEIGARAFDAAEALLRESLPEAENEAERGRILALLGQLALRRGETSAARDLLSRSLPLLARAGDLQAQADTATVLVWSLVARDHGFTEARERLDTLPADWRAPGEVRYLEAYYRGVLATAIGDLRSALEHFERAISRARRTGSDRQRRAAEEMAAVQLLKLGRHAEAAAAFAALAEEAGRAGDPCRRAGLLGNLGLNALEARASGGEGEDPRTALRLALATLEEECAEDLPERRSALLNLALAELEAEEPVAARAALAAAAALPAEVSLRSFLWRREVEGRLALAEGRPRAALGIFESLAETAAAALEPEARWQAEVGVALARRALGDPEGALAALGRGERRLDSELLLVPLQEGRESFLARRERATALHLELLLDQGRVEEALALARRARLRLLRHLNLALRLSGLDAGERGRWEGLAAEVRRERALVEEAAAGEWELAAGALAAVRRERAEARERLGRDLDSALAALDPAAGRGAGRLPPLVGEPGTLTLLFHPLPRGWALFAHRGGETRLHRPPCPTSPPAAAAECLLRPAAAWLEEAAEIRVLAAGAMTAVDFQTVPFAGDILLARAPIVYDLDLGPSEAGRGAAEELPASALILADPKGDLPRARQEAERVRGLLAPRAGVELLLGRGATPAALAAALPRAELFHFAGHARFAGRGGWRSYLPLDGGGRLSLEDVLLLEHPPRWVVLSGCETARAAEERTVAERVGLAQAFLAAGSESVLAATRPVGDRLAADLVAAFYPAWLGGMEPAAALRRAQLDLRRGEPAGDWASFRVLER